jgi:hypothetical protein
VGWAGVGWLRVDVVEIWKGREWVGFAFGYVDWFGLCSNYGYSLGWENRLIDWCMYTYWVSVNHDFGRLVQQMMYGMLSCRIHNPTLVVLCVLLLHLCTVFCCPSFGSRITLSIIVALALRTENRETP